VSDGVVSRFGEAPDQTPIGLVGTVVTATRGQDGPGEVEFSIRGGTEVFIARSEEPLPVGSTVLCVDVLGARSIVVAPW